MISDVLLKTTLAFTIIAAAVIIVFILLLAIIGCIQKFKEREYILGGVSSFVIVWMILILVAIVLKYEFGL